MGRITMSRITGRILFVGLIGLPISSLVGCGGNGTGGDGATGPVEGAGLLKAVASEEEFLNSLKAGIQALVIDQDGNVNAAQNDSAAESSSEFSTTYSLEANVGEYDIVKYDGEHLYIARQLGYSCCFFDSIIDSDIDADVVTVIAEPETSAIRIMTTDPDSASVEEISQIELPAGENLLGMFLEEDQLVAITSEYFYGSYGDIWANYGGWSDAETGLKIYGVSDAAAPSLDWDISIEGGITESRRIGDWLYLVTRHNVAPRGFSRYAYTDVDIAANQEAIDDLSIDDIAATVVINGVESDLFSASDCLIDNDLEDQGSATITSITAMSVTNPQNWHTVCYPESADGVYITEQSLYITDVRYSSEDGSSETRIHKFGLSDSSTDYLGSADVQGSLWSGGQNDFRISEYQDQLRLVTTETDWDSDDRFDHHLYILEENPDELSLSLVSELPNSLSPDELGKDNENLYGVRFQNERAYLVTFEQIDPLYVLDLSDPADPFIAGELEVTGFSDFLHPVNDDLLLGLGRENNLVKLELFNVTDMTNPISQDLLLVDQSAGWSWSDAQYDRHAFTYLSDIDGVDRFTIPLDSWGGDSSNNSSLLEFEISAKDSPSIAALTQVGKIVADGGDSSYSVGARSVIDGNAVFFISEAQVWSAFWGETGTEEGPK